LNFLHIIQKSGYDFVDTASFFDIGIFNAGGANAIADMFVVCCYFYIMINGAGSNVKLS
jgi:hypothetical protein